MTNQTRTSYAIGISIGAVGIALVGAAAWWLITALISSPSSARQPIVSASLSHDVEKKIVLHMADADEVTPPFVIVPDVASSKGSVLSLPDAGGANNKGQAIRSFAVETEGSYVVWALTKWHDSCGNSLLVAIDNAPHYSIGQDAAYGQWHWVPAGKCQLETGVHRLTVIGREDGIEIDQFLLTTDSSFIPGEAVSGAFSGWDPRRFADDFSRSPGHGLGEWDVTGAWEIAFTLDPNRIPYQYALIGSSTNAEESVAMARGMPWRGFQASFSFLSHGAAQFGVLFDQWETHGNGLRLRVQLDEEGRAELALMGEKLQERVDISSIFAVDQWHRVVIERWAWILRVYIDDQLVLSRADLTPTSGHLGVFVTEGRAVVDDVDIASIPWAADDDSMRTVQWRVPTESRWYRTDRYALLGENGPIDLMPGELAIDEVIIDGSNSNCRVSGAGLTLTHGADAGSFDLSSAGESLKTISLIPQDGEAQIKRFAVKYRAESTDVYRIGPYHFSEDKVADPADYLDFTDEEYEQMKNSKDSEKLRRDPKYLPLLSYGENSMWRLGSRRSRRSRWSRYIARWRIKDGVLIGRGPDATLVHTRKILAEGEVRLRYQLVTSNSCAEVMLYSYGNVSANVRLVSTVPPTTQEAPLLH